MMLVIYIYIIHIQYYFALLASGVWNSKSRILNGVNMNAEPNTTAVSWNIQGNDVGKPVSIKVRKSNLLVIFLVTVFFSIVYW